MEILYTGANQPLFVETDQFYVNPVISNHKGTIILMHKVSTRVYPPTDFDMFYVHATGLDETNALAFECVYNHPNALIDDDRSSYTMIIEPPTCSEINTWRCLTVDDIQHIKNDEDELITDQVFREKMYEQSRPVYCRDGNAIINETLRPNDLITVDYENISILMLCVEKTKSSIQGILLDPIDHNNRRICIYLTNNQSYHCSVNGYCDNTVYWTREHITFRKMIIRETV